MTGIPNESDKRVSIIKRQGDGKYVLRVGDGSAVLDDDQLAMLGRVAIGRAIPDAEYE